jgi:hypothetical protein
MSFLQSRCVFSGHPAATFSPRMSTTQPLPGEKPGGGSLSSAAEAGAKQSLVPAPQQPQKNEEGALRSPVTRLPVELDVVIPVRAFKVCDLLALHQGRLIESQWASGEDLRSAAGSPSSPFLPSARDCCGAPGAPHCILLPLRPRRPRQAQKSLHSGHTCSSAAHRFCETTHRLQHFCGPARAPVSQSSTLSRQAMARTHPAASRGGGYE